MFIYFEDWTAFKSHLIRKGVPKEMLADKFVKAQVSSQDPRELGHAVQVLQYSGEPFSMTEIFDYGERGTYTGEDFEAELKAKGLKNEEMEGARALLRMGLDPRLRYLDRVMMAKDSDGTFLKDHLVDAVEIHADHKTLGILPHYDLFSIGTMGRLGAMIDLTTEGSLFSPRDGIAFRESLKRSMEEGARKERR